MQESGTSSYFGKYINVALVLALALSLIPLPAFADESSVDHDCAARFEGLEYFDFLNEETKDIFAEQFVAWFETEIGIHGEEFLCEEGSVLQSEEGITARVSCEGAVYQILYDPVLGDFSFSEVKVDLPALEEEVLDVEEDSGEIDNGAASALSSSIAAPTSAVQVLSYQTHVQNIGWQGSVAEGKTSGTSGQSLRLEGIKINLAQDVKRLGGSINYSTHVQNIGWQNAVSDGGMSGTSGQSLRLEAIRINLSGAVAGSYDIYYRVHAQNVGWMGWAKNGASSGTAGYSYRLEAIQIVLVAKGGIAPSATGSSTATCFADAHVTAGNMSYTSFLHIQNIGDKNYDNIKGNTLMGTSGHSLRLEAFSIKLNNTGGISGGISYRTHVQNIGWQDWVKDGARAGTSRQSLRLEALQVKLTGDLANYYDVYYQVHVENIGWQGWVANGSIAGTSGMSYRLEAMRIALVKKGETPPVAVGNAGGSGVGTTDTNSYTVTFKNWDGTTLSSALYKAGSTPTPPTFSLSYYDGISYRDGAWTKEKKTYTYSAPQKANNGTTTYTFTGWDRAISPVTKNTTYTAQYRVMDLSKGGTTYGTVTADQMNEYSKTQCTSSTYRYVVGSKYSITEGNTTGATADSLWRGVGNHGSQLQKTEWQRVVEGSKVTYFYAIYTTV